MASTPQFTATPRIGYGSVSTANTARDGSGTIVTILTAGSSGGRVEEIVVEATDNPADSIVTIFLDPTGSAGFKLFDEFDLNDPAAASTTVAAYRGNRVYTNLILAAGAKIGAAVTVAPTAGAINVFTFGGDM